MSNRYDKPYDIGILIYGGQSLEHNASIGSCIHMNIPWMDSFKYFGLIYVTTSGKWIYQPSFIHNPVDPREFMDLSGFGYQATPGVEITNYARYLTHRRNVYAEDIYVLPLIHGTQGEDGTLLGYLKFCNFNIIGSDLLGSAASLDKTLCKKICSFDGIPTGKFYKLNADDYSKKHNDQQQHTYNKITQHLGTDKIFVKPNSLGSSIGVGTSNDFDTFHQAVKNAFTFEHKLICEPHYQNKIELECAILQTADDELIVSDIGQITNPSDQILSYRDKYRDREDDEEELVKTVDFLSDQQLLHIQQLSKKIFNLLELSSLARIDWFYLPDNKDSDDWLVLNEVNTLPGLASYTSHFFLLLGLNDKITKMTPIMDHLIQTAVARRKKHSLFLESITENYDKIDGQKFNFKF